MALLFSCSSFHLTSQTKAGKQQRDLFGIVSSSCFQKVKMEGTGKRWKGGERGQGGKGGKGTVSCCLSTELGGRNLEGLCSTETGQEIKTFLYCNRVGLVRQMRFHHSRSTVVQNANVWATEICFNFRILCWLSKDKWWLDVLCVLV